MSAQVLPPTANNTTAITSSETSSKVDEQDAIMSLLGIARSSPPKIVNNDASESPAQLPPVQVPAGQQTTATTFSYRLPRTQPPRFPQILLRDMGKKRTDHAIVSGQFEDAPEMLIPPPYGSLPQATMAVTRADPTDPTNLVVAPPPREDPQRLNRNFEADTAAVNLRSQLAAIAAAAGGFSHTPLLKPPAGTMPTQPQAQPPQPHHLEAMLRAQQMTMPKLSPHQQMALLRQSPKNGTATAQPQTAAANPNTPATPTNNDDSPIVNPYANDSLAMNFHKSASQTMAASMAPEQVMEAAKSVQVRTPSRVPTKLLNLPKEVVQKQERAKELRRFDILDGNQSAAKNGYALRKQLQVPTMQPPKGAVGAAAYADGSSTKMRYQAYVPPPSWAEITKVPKMPPTEADDECRNPISEVNDNDVLLGRGGMTNSNPGNVRFRNLIGKYRMAYCTAPKGDKGALARFLCNYVRFQKGRFLRRDDQKTAVWYEVGDEKAVMKCGQALRENTAEMVRRAVGVTSFSTPNKKQKLK